MTDPKVLSQVKSINALPVSQACLKHLQALKQPVDHQELYCLRLLLWAQKEGILELDTELSDVPLRMVDLEPKRVARLLRLETMGKAEHWSAADVANFLACEIQDRAKGITPEEADE